MQIIIGSAPPSNTAPLNLISELQNVFSSMKASQKRAIVYTDGSTPPRSSKPNSGASIYVTDENHKEIWSGGIIVRTVGNNFIAELAAASIVINACPLQFSINLRIDSKAAIGAIAKGPLSERKRVRAPGRAWL